MAGNRKIGTYCHCQRFLVRALISIFCLVGTGFVSAEIGLTRKFITDDATGVALFGFDPVAYFIEQKAIEGTNKLEFVWQNTVWRFEKEGNLEAFKQHPYIYAPIYGGYDAMGVSRGFLSVGNPAIWIIRENRLYFFKSVANRIAWLNDPDRHILRASGHWPNLDYNLPG
ncbi:MAG: hypothetical protein JKY49_01810 [Cohaesibacteraceae bacterium]|nr:hypothetical protein [Cohaesibacteraceae bacterium]MBL4875002.1 hypothetical protein [Cohaesibacteraceae bacterium]